MKNLAKLLKHYKRLRVKMAIRWNILTVCKKVSRSFVLVNPNLKSQRKQSTFCLHLWFVRIFCLHLCFAHFLLTFVLLCIFCLHLCFVRIFCLHLCFVAHFLLTFVLCLRWLFKFQISKQQQSATKGTINRYTQDYLPDVVSSPADMNHRMTLGIVHGWIPLLLVGVLGRIGVSAFIAEWSNAGHHVYEGAMFKKLNFEVYG